MTPSELVLTIIDMHQRHAPMATIFTVAARALRAERERCATLCDQTTDQRAREMGLAHYEHLTGRLCAAAIRALD